MVVGWGSCCGSSITMSTGECALGGRRFGALEVRRQAFGLVSAILNVCSEGTGALHHRRLLHTLRIALRWEGTSTRSSTGRRVGGVQRAVGGKVGAAGPLLHRPVAAEK